MLKNFVKIKKLIPFVFAFMVAGCFCPANSIYATTINEVDKNCEEDIQFNLKSNFEFHYIFKDIDKKLKANEQLNNVDNRILPRSISLYLLNKTMFEQIKKSLESELKENIKKYSVEEIEKLKENLKKEEEKKEEEIEKICSHLKECFENIDIRFDYDKIPQMLFDNISEPIFTFSERDQKISTIINYTTKYKMHKIEKTDEVKGPKEIEETKKKREIAINTVRDYMCSIFYNILNKIVNKNENMSKLIDKTDAKLPYILDPTDFNKDSKKYLSEEGDRLNENLNKKAEIEKYLDGNYDKLKINIDDVENFDLDKFFKDNNMKEDECLKGDLKRIKEKKKNNEKYNDEVLDFELQIIRKRIPGYFVKKDTFYNKSNVLDCYIDLEKGLGKDEECEKLQNQLDELKSLGKQIESGDESKRDEYKNKIIKFELNCTEKQMKRKIEEDEKLLKKFEDPSNFSFIENCKKNLKSFSKESVDKEKILEVVNPIVDKLKPYISSKEKTVEALKKFRDSVKDSKDKVKEALKEIKKLIEDKEIDDEDKNIIKSLDGCDTSEEGLKKLENEINDSENCLNRARKIFSNAQSYKDALLNSQSAEEYFEEIKKIMDEIELTKLYIY